MNAVKERTETTKYFDASNTHTPYHFGKELATLIKKNMAPGQELVFLCIGSDRATGDSLGPLIGHKLSHSTLMSAIVYGTLEQPVHAKNLVETMGKIKKAHERAFIVAIDASLGTTEHIGYISLGACSLKPGAGVAKELPEVGDLSITGIVNLSGLFDHMLLQTTRLHIVMQMADCICRGISYTSVL